MTLIGILALVVALVISIALHEVGHMVPAKKFGVKVTQYMVGFGPTIWSTKKGDTEYGAKAVLLGGYIRMIGMFLRPRRQDQSKQHRPARDSDRTGPRGVRGRDHGAGRREADVLQPLRAEEARGDARRTHHEPADRLGPVHRGVRRIRHTDAQHNGVHGHRVCSDRRRPRRNLRGGVGDTTGAAAAGLQTGDQIVAWDAVPVSDWPILSQAIRDSQPGNHEVTVVRDGREITLEFPSPRLTVRCSATPRKLADSWECPRSWNWNRCRSPRYPGKCGTFR